MIRDGSAGAQGGGGLHITGGNTRLTRCVIAHNVAIGQNEWGGGAMTVLDGVLSMSECRVVDNLSPGGAGRTPFWCGNQVCRHAHCHRKKRRKPGCSHQRCLREPLSTVPLSTMRPGVYFLNTPRQSDSVTNCILWTNGPYDIARERADSDVFGHSTGVGWDGEHHLRPHVCRCADGGLSSPPGVSLHRCRRPGISVRPGWNTLGHGSVLLRPECGWCRWTGGQQHSRLCTA